MAALEEAPMLVAAGVRRKRKMAKRWRVFDRATALACLMPREFDGDQQDQQ
jgi:hypothetical protein